MRAIVVDEASAGRELRIAEVPEPQCSPGEVVIAVRAAGVNRADLLQRAGKYPPPSGASTILGLEVSGIVERVGEGVTTPAAGDEVCALLSGGGYAEKVAVPAAHVMPKPQGLSFIEAAAVPEAFLTAYTNLFLEGQLRSGERVLIHGGSSGVGTAAIQVAREAGAVVACTVGNEQKAAACRELGAALCVNYRTEDFSERARAWTGSAGVDLVLDMVGADYFARNISILGQCGRLVVIATMRGARTELDLSVLMRKRLRVVGSVLRSRSMGEKAEIVRGFMARFGDALGGAIRPIVDTSFPLDRAVDAHARMQSSEHIGKIVLTL